ncbi:MAG: alpha/beta hydrolase [Bacteroidales bacterium]|nr:alpha/beta hydrolase [Bacteroidales bacterium]
MKRLFSLLLALAIVLPSCGSNPGGVSGSYTADELWLQNGSNRIFGILYRPEGVEKAPVVIVSHGYGGTHQAGKDYAEALAPMGYAVYMYDFCGGSNHSRSDGKTTQMSIFSEAGDLKAVIDALGEKEYIDGDYVTLIGESQGGMVSSLVAAERGSDIERLILIYPALCIKDDWVKMYPALSDMPQEVDFWGMKLGHAYLEGLYDLDVYKTISQYEGPVSIFHGDKDQVVSVSYSERAKEAYKNATLTVLPGEGHGFSAKARKGVIAAICQTLSGK